MSRVMALPLKKKVQDWGLYEWGGAVASTAVQCCLKALIERPRVSIELRKSAGDLRLQSSDGALTHGTLKRTRIGRYGCPLADGVTGNFDMKLKTIGVLANAEGLNRTDIRLGNDLGIGRDVGDLCPVPLENGHRVR
jgi:hypothetical protein